MCFDGRWWWWWWWGSTDPLTSFTSPLSYFSLTLHTHSTIPLLVPLRATTTTTTTTTLSQHHLCLPSSRLVTLPLFYRRVCTISTPLSSYTLSFHFLKTRCCYATLAKHTSACYTPTPKHPSPCHTPPTPHYTCTGYTRTLPNTPSLCRRLSPPRMAPKSIFPETRSLGGHQSSIAGQLQGCAAVISRFAGIIGG